MKTVCLERRYDGPVIVAAPGPSLDSKTAELCRGTPCVVVNDAFKLMPFADALYACDEDWWFNRRPEFDGEKWSSHNDGTKPRNDKRRVNKFFSVSVVRGQQAKGFSLDPSVIHYGGNSGFQAVNIAILWGGNPVIMVGFDMRGSHFFGEHKYPLRQKKSFYGWITAFREASEMLPSDIRIINATPGSDLKCFPIMTLAEALSESRTARPQD